MSVCALKDQEKERQDSRHPGQSPEHLDINESHVFETDRPIKASLVDARRKMHVHEAPVEDCHPEYAADEHDWQVHRSQQEWVNSVGGERTESRTEVEMLGVDPAVRIDLQGVARLLGLYGRKTFWSVCL